VKDPHSFAFWQRSKDCEEVSCVDQSEGHFKRGDGKLEVLKEQPASCGENNTKIYLKTGPGAEDKVKTKKTVWEYEMK
jgi:hypothetical protein